MLTSCDVRGDLLVLAVEHARIDAQSVDQMMDEMREHLNSNSLDCALDLSKVSFMDSTGISTLVSLLKHVGPDRRLELCGLTPQVQKTMKLTRLDNVFYTRPSVRDAELARGTRSTSN